MSSGSGGRRDACGHCVCVQCSGEEASVAHPYPHEAGVDAVRVSDATALSHLSCGEAKSINLKFKMFTLNPLILS